MTQTDLTVNEKQTGTVRVTRREAEIILGFLTTALGFRKEVTMYSELFKIGIAFRWDEITALQKKLTEFLAEN